MRFEKKFRRALGRYLEKRRTKKGLTRFFCAEKLAVSPQFYGAIEKGKVPCPDRALSKLISLLDLEKSKLTDVFRLGIEEKIASLFK
jgi:transcriptional regulator with XRE-family HTH domain